MTGTMAELVRIIKQGIGFFYHNGGIWHFAGVSFLIFVAVLVAKGFLTRSCYWMVVKIFPSAREDIADTYFPAFEKPLAALLVSLGVYAAISYLPLNPEQMMILVRLFRSFLIIIVSWGFYNLTGGYSSFLKIFGRKLNIDLDEILIPFVSKTLRFIIIALTIAVIAGEWGYDINGFVAGLGLGGLAVALAAKDAIANIFGGIIILMDKPFTVGDWVSIPEIEGTVEEVSFRSTRIRTFDQALVTVPNQVLANKAIINWSRMGKRRVSFTLRVAHSTPGDKLKKCVDGISKMLKEHPEVHEESIFVNFDNITKDSLEIYIHYFTLTTERGKYLSVKENINLKIMAILEQDDIHIALPGRSVYFENEACPVLKDSVGT